MLGSSRSGCSWAGVLAMSIEAVTPGRKGAMAIFGVGSEAEDGSEVAVYALLYDGLINERG